jgi:hypothetical protein
MPNLDAAADAAAALVSPASLSLSLALLCPVSPSFAACYFFVSSRQSLGDPTCLLNNKKGPHTMRRALLFFYLVGVVSCRAAAAVEAAAALPTLPTLLPIPTGPAIGASVILLGEYDWEITPGADGGPWQRCADKVRRGITGSGGAALQLIPTLGFFLQPSNPPSSSSPKIQQFCMFVSGQPNSPSPCQPLTPAHLATFKQGIEHCLTTAFESGARVVAIRPHLDAGDGSGAWRNGLLLEPARRYDGQISYVDAMLHPLADAIAGAQARWAPQALALGQPLPRVDFALQGEMSATVVRFSEQWRGLVEAVRARAAGAAATTDSVRIGVGMNFNRLDDLSSTGQTHNSSRLSWAAWALGLTDAGKGGADVPAVDGPALGALLRSVEFLSISAYAPISGPGFAPDELGNSAFMVVEQLVALGVPGATDGDLFAPSGPLELQYGEIGLGGGTSFKGHARAMSPAEVALRPFFGVYGERVANSDPWAIPANAAFRREFYAKLSAWLEPGAANKRYHVAAAYLWGHGSWDALGVYYFGYRDDAIATILRKHNCLVGMATWGGGGGSCGGFEEGALVQEEKELLLDEGGVVTILSRDEEGGDGAQPAMFVNRVTAAAP